MDPSPDFCEVRDLDRFMIVIPLLNGEAFLTEDDGVNEQEVVGLLPRDLTGVEHWTDGLTRS